MAAPTIQQEQLHIFGSPRMVASGQRGANYNQQPFGPNLDGISRSLASYAAMFTPGQGQSVNPILHEGGESDYAAWQENSYNPNFNEYMETPKSQYFMYGLDQQQHMPMMEQSNTESQFKAFILAVNAAFQKASR